MKNTYSVLAGSSWVSSIITISDDESWSCDVLGKRMIVPERKPLVRGTLDWGSELILVNAKRWIPCYIYIL